MDSLQQGYGAGSTAQVFHGDHVHDVPEPVSDTVNIVFAADEAFLPYTAVTLASLLKHYSGSKALRVFLLLERPLTPEHRVRFEALANIHPYKLEEFEVDASVFADVRTTDGLTLATYFRLFLHELLPADIGKVLYLDSDLIIRRSIDALFDMTFDGNLFCGVEDSRSRDYKNKFGVPESGRHINAGVMLVNVERMRAIGFSNLIRDYLEVNRHRVVLGDQQIVGELFFDSIRYIPVKWNVHGSLFDPLWAKESFGVLNDMNAQDVAAAVIAPAIIHYTFRRKPWMSLEHPRAELWFDYLTLTGYVDEIERPKARRKKLGAPLADQHPESDKILRWTRSILDRVAYAIDCLKGAPPVPGGIPSGAKPHGRPQPRKPDLAIKLKQVLLDRAARAPARFNAREAFEALPENSRILSNVGRKDSDGGYAENIKFALRTPYIRYKPSASCDAVALLSQRIHQGMFWDCIETAYLYDKPLFFIEVALFAGFASFFDPQATLDERRALGFMVDDLGYYFDSRQPSRLERTLTDPSFSLTDAERGRARSLIDRIVRNHITKYNKYTRQPVSRFEVKPRSILVVDQKKGDASIEFAGAGNAEFEAMLRAACEENRDAMVYFKRHPDTVLGQRAAFSSSDFRNLSVVPDDIPIHVLLDRCSAVYTVSSQVGFEALMRNKRVVTFGQPFYAGWGLTEDRNPLRRRTARRTIDEIFHVACLELSVYVNPKTGKMVEMEEVLDIIEELRARLHLRG
jgi:Capsule polysaccharide export protein